MVEAIVHIDLILYFDTKNVLNMANSAEPDPASHLCLRYWYMVFLGIFCKCIYHVPTIAYIEL